MSNFIFMLTRDDRTVADAHRLVDLAVEVGVTHIGFKDIGLPWIELADLARHITESGVTSYLEVVSTAKEDEIKSLRAAVDLGVDYVLGGVHPTEGAELLRDSPAAYFPFPGTIVGHPSVLTGTIEEIVDSARRIAAIPGVDGLDLLAYRFAGDVERLMQRVVQSVDVPVIMAGSVDRTARIVAARDSGAWGFTIGTAVIDGSLSVNSASREVSDLLRTVARLA